MNKIIDKLSPQDLGLIRSIGQTPDEILSSEIIPLSDELQILEIRQKSLQTHNVEYIGFDDLIEEFNTLDNDLSIKRHMMYNDELSLVVYSSEKEDIIHGWYVIPE